MKETLPLWVLRGLFLAAAIGAAWPIMTHQHVEPWPFAHVIPILAAVAAIFVILLDVFIPRKRIELISSVYFGLIVGLLLTWILSRVFEPMTQTMGNAGEVIRQGGILLLGTIICYVCISLLWQTRDDFRFAIPYVEFSREVKGIKPYVLDTSVVIDGRIADVIETDIIDNPLIMPRFVLTELQSIADSSDRLRRARGRRGLDVLNRLRTNPNIEFRIYDRELDDAENESVDMKLLALARHLDAKLLTGDYNLNKIAKLQNVTVINLNDLANAMKPVFLPGEQITVRIVKPGEEAGQGVGYLEDGTMIVVEDGRTHIGKEVKIHVTSMLQTSAGRMVFGRFSQPV